MADSPRLAPQFGGNIDPGARRWDLARSLAQLADRAGLDFIGIQDHPYNPNFLDTWTLLTALGVLTERVRLLPNVLNLPLRPPALLAKAAASLDVLTGGRVELGLGAGGFWDGIAAYGGPRRTPGEAVAALDEALGVIRALWQPPTAGPIHHAGPFYPLDGAQPGPVPAHPIGIWLGALGPRMVRLTGARADGWIISASYIPPEAVPPLQDTIDAAAAEAGRPPTAIRRAYNLGGLILPPGQTNLRAARRGVLVGPVQQWVDEIVRYYRDLRMDTFLFWPINDELAQMERFAAKVVPAVRAALGL
jgi:alkanesulfonate monooxygenase SsuD/methylene tetrahydromethanopterin reductase-like flavin-dependent oxidoreductase (luciferase family)